jgi:RNA polymerase sigma-70 factor, ECF subfamily
VRGCATIERSNVKRGHEPRLEGQTASPWGAAELGREALVYADPLYNLARYLTGNTTEAEDLVQETYARALRAATQFTPGTNLKAWLFRILRNTFVSAYRRQRQNPIVGGLDTVTPTDEPVNDNWFQHDIDLDRLRSVVRDEIEAAVMRLSVDARTVLLLDLEGLTENEVANVVGCAVGTVKSRLARARAALRHELRDYGIRVAAHRPHGALRDIPPTDTPSRARERRDHSRSALRGDHA